MSCRTWPISTRSAARSAERCTCVSATAPILKLDLYARNADDFMAAISERSGLAIE